MSKNLNICNFNEIGLVLVTIKSESFVIILVLLWISLLFKKCITENFF